MLVLIVNFSWCYNAAFDKWNLSKIVTKLFPKQFDDIPPLNRSIITWMLRQISCTLIKWCTHLAKITHINPPPPPLPYPLPSYWTNCPIKEVNISKVNYQEYINTSFVSPGLRPLEANITCFNLILFRLLSAERCL